MSIKSLKVATAFAALLFVTLAGSAYASPNGISPAMQMTDTSIAAQNAVVQGG